MILLVNNTKPLIYIRLDFCAHVRYVFIYKPYFVKIISLFSCINQPITNNVLVLILLALGTSIVTLVSSNRFDCFLLILMVMSRSFSVSPLGIEQAIGLISLLGNYDGELFFCSKRVLKT